jgi:DNA topoisomerase-1
VRVENKRFYSEKMGEIVTDRLVESFQDFLDFSFTARMEETLDDIATGKQNWKTILNQFFSELDEQVKAASDTESGMRGNKPTGTGIECPSCHLGEMQVRTASTGVFLGCSRYALPPKERCKHTINLIPADEWIVRDDEDAEVRELRSRHRCPICGTAMDSYLIDEKRKLHVCGNNPDCPGIEIENGQFKLKGYEGPTVECDKCHAPMQLKSGRFGKYFGCTNTECKNTRKILKNGEVAPPKMDPIPMPHLRCAKNDDHFILRDGATGLFLAASKFPKHRETRPPRIEELLSIKNQLDPKYHYLLSAPLTDPEGNPTIVRYSRKAKTCYVGSEKEGKPTSWRAFYKKGQWDSGAQE